jgi:uncharacterized protein
MNDTTRRPFLAFEVKAISEDKRTIEGYASVFGNVDSYGDRVMPGAFLKSLKENASRVKVAYQHDVWDGLVGKPLEIREDSFGLFTKSYISKTAKGDELLTLAKDGVIDEMSIGYNLVPGKFYENEFGGLDLHEVKLREYSFVTWGANSLAKVTAVKSLVGRLSPEELESLKALLGTEPGLPTQPPSAAAASVDEPVLHSLADALSAINRAIPQLKGFIS